MKAPVHRAGVLLAAALCTVPLIAQAAHDEPYFQRISHFPVFLNTDVDAETVAEIVAASEDGMTLIYTDAETGSLGFVDISDPHHPAAAGTFALPGEPTSVAVAGPYALAAVNTSPSLVAPSGQLVVIDIASRQQVAQFELGGQPDAVAVSPDGRYAAIAIENERDEDLGDGAPPQPPAGFLTVVTLDGAPADWTLEQVDLTGLAALYPDDPEPEYVAINRSNMAAVSLQENNHIVIVRLGTNRVLRHFSAGAVDLTQIDTEENDSIEPTGSLQGVLREPDGLTWVSSGALVTANEGDLDGGSRGHTAFGIQGQVRADAGSTLEHAAIRLGHYPEHRSENKGNEPENVAAGRYGSQRYLFVGSERANLVFVHRVDALGRGPLHQTLPAGVGPEGLLALPERNLLVVASEVDARDDKIRSALTLYELQSTAPRYPTVQSADVDGAPLPWGALSGLAVDPAQPDTAYSVHDSFYRESRIFTLDLAAQPAIITAAIRLRDGGALAAVAPDLVNAGGSVNLDLEGIGVRSGGGFWLVSEGAGSVDDAQRPVETPNLLLRVGADGSIEQVVTLPEAVAARQRRFGFEGVAATGAGQDEVLYVAFQREWVGDAEDRVRIGRYAVASGEWSFYHYPLDAPASANGGWVGLSDIVALGDDSFAVIERDNQAGTDAAVKRLYRFSVAGLTPLADAGEQNPAFPLLQKTLARDLLPDLTAPGGPVLEKVEGLAVLPHGGALVVNDNDGVDDASGETQLLRLPQVF